MLEKINVNKNNIVFKGNLYQKNLKKLKKPEINRYQANPIPFTKSIFPIGNIYGINIFKHNVNSVEKIYSALTKGASFKVDDWTLQNRYFGSNRPDKVWVAGVEPAQALKRDLKDSINSILTLAYGTEVPKKMPKVIKTPNYGDNWGRNANYIEINNRALAQMKNNRTTGAMVGAIKMLPLIPPSADKWANCVLISQLYPNIWGDSWNNNGENSLYGIVFDNNRLAENIGELTIGGHKFSKEDMVKAFNDLAHLRGLKTSFRMIISEDQLKINNDICFRWNNPEHVEAFISACCKGIELGFDGIFFDSVKHVGNYDMQHYAGVGAVVGYEQMQYILNEIRRRTGRGDLSFSGEKAENDTERYRFMGLNAGASQMNAADINEVKNSSNSQKYSREFAWGPVVSDDNDEGNKNFEYRLEAIKASLFGYDNPYDKLPSFMQMADLFPLNYGINTHQLMMQNVNLSTNETPTSHYDNLFATGENDANYRKRVAQEFAHVYNYLN